MFSRFSEMISTKILIFLKNEKSKIDTVEINVMFENF